MFVIWLRTLVVHGWTRNYGAAKLYIGNKWLLLGLSEIKSMKYPELVKFIHIGAWGHHHENTVWFWTGLSNTHEWTITETVEKLVP